MQHNPAQVYSPADDTFLLLEAARKEIRREDRVIEVGTGSGEISAALNRDVQSLVATDINPHAVFFASRRGISVIRTDLFSGICGVFDLVLFNPPYLPTQPEERVNDWLEYALDGGASGRDVIERFLGDVGRILTLDGRILLLISSLTGLPDVTEMAAGAGFSTKIVEERIVEDERLYVLRLVRKMIENAE